MPHLPEPLRHQHGGPEATLFAREYLAPYGNRIRPTPRHKRTSGLLPYGSALALVRWPGRLLGQCSARVGSQSLGVLRLGLELV